MNIILVLGVNIRESDSKYENAAEVQGIQVAVPNNTRTQDNTVTRNKFLVLGSEPPPWRRTGGGWGDKGEGTSGLNCSDTHHARAPAAQQIKQKKQRRVRTTGLA